MTNFICEYCNKTYANKSTLSTHQKSTKRCLEIQKNLNKKNDVIEYNCQYCNKIFTTRQNIKVHENICDGKKDFEIKELKDIITKYESEIKELREIKKEYDFEQKLKNKYIFEIEDLRNTNEKYLEEIHRLRETVAGLQGELKSANKASECVYDLAKQPKNNNNNHITNNNGNTTTNNNNKTLNISGYIDFKNIDKVKEIIDEKYDINYILSGQKGCAQFAAQYLLLDENGKYVYLCTDPSRHSFKYKNEIGEIEKDLEAKKLTNYLIDGGIQEKAKNVSLNWCQNDGIIDQEKFTLVSEKQLSIMNIKENNNEFKRELSSIIS
jgi:hypothetical protein